MALACSSDSEFTGPPQPAPTLEYIRPDDLGPAPIFYGVDPPEGFLRIFGWAADPGFQASAASDFPLHLRASSGDLETTSLRQHLCGPPPLRNDWWICNSLMFSMHDGHHAFEVYPRVQRLGGRFNIVSVSGRYAGLQLFGTSVDAAMREVKRWPGVNFVEHSSVAWLACTTCGPPPEVQVARTLEATIKLDLKPPIVRNGVLEAFPGDTVEATYVQPDSSVLRIQFLIPPCNPAAQPHIDMGC